MWQLLLVVLMTLAYFVVQYWLGRVRLAVLWTIFLLVPLALTPYWFAVNDFDLFAWVKIYSVMFGVCWAGWLRFTPMGDKPWLRVSIPLVLVANIFEAFMVDLSGQGSAHLLNALAGVFLIATTPLSLKHTRVDRAGRHQTMLCDLPFTWICGYTAWNWTFVYLNYPELTGHHTAVLSAALIVACIDSKQWLQARAATLGANLIFFATSHSGTLAISDATSWFDESIAMAVASMSFAWMAIHALSKLNTQPVIARMTAVREELLDGARGIVGAHKIVAATILGRRSFAKF